MAKKLSSSTIPQDYPRIQDTDNHSHGCLDDSQLVQHQHKIVIEKLKGFIRQAILNANKKSSREIISIPLDASPETIDKIHEREGKELFKYFKKYCGDPASTAHQAYRKHYSEVGIDQFRNKTLQRERMNSGWRYQFLVVSCAGHSKRFKNISDIAAAEGDFNAIIEFTDDQRKPLSLYVSVKNRVNTMGGQDWPKAIQALETVARTDKNRTGPYCCIFGIAMDRGQRTIKKSQKTHQPHSFNTEVWLSDFFWPFFTNYSYEEIMTSVLEVLISESGELLIQVDVPTKLLDAFGQACQKEGLLDESGHFYDPFKLVKFFCQPSATSKKR